ncbi:hypothetical protein [Nitrospira sp. Kam-Ns4a]
MTDCRPTTLGLPLVLGGCLLLTACLPSRPYQQGEGFYSRDFTEEQVQTAARAGQVTDLGPFSFEVSSCGNYTRDLADQNLVEEPLAEKLPMRGANAADRIAAKERADFALLSLLVLPMGCSEATLTGRALFVEAPPPAPTQPGR